MSTATSRQLSRRRFRRLAVVGALTVIAAGCGDPGPDPTPQQEQAISTLIDSDLTGDESRCLLEGLIASEVPAAAIIDGALTPEQDTAITAVTLECIEDLSRIPSFVASFVEGAAEEGVTLTDAQARCAIQTLDDDTAGSAEAIAACVGTDGPPADGPDDYGDDEVLDLLWDACEGGNNQACDELYLTSPLRSGYEEYARTCAGRLPDSVGARCFDDLD